MIILPANTLSAGSFSALRKSYRNPVIEIENPHIDAQQAAGIKEPAIADASSIF